LIPMGEPTVRLVVTVLTPGGWKALDDMPPAFEYVFTVHELRRVLRSYGNVVGEVLRRQGCSASVFRIVARGVKADRMLGIHEWAWDRHEAAYVACGSAFLAWPAPAELPDHIRTGAALHSEAEPIELCA
jgi:hypothetical protein